MFKFCVVNLMHTSFQAIKSQVWTKTLHWTHKYIHLTVQLFDIPCYCRDLILSNLGLCIKLLWMFLMSSTAVHSKLELQNISTWTVDKASEHISHHWALLNVYWVNIILLSLQFAANSVLHILSVCKLSSSSNYHLSYHISCLKSLVFFTYSSLLLQNLNY